MSTPNESDGSPDFSFLGDDAVPDGAEDFDFSTAEDMEQPPEDSAIEVPDAPDVSDVPEFPDAPDFPDMADLAKVEAVDNAPELNFNTETTTTKSDDLASVPDGPPASEAPPKKSAIRRLKPKSKVPDPAESVAARELPVVQEEPTPEPDKPQLETAEEANSEKVNSDEAATTENDVTGAGAGEFVSKKSFSLVAGYAAALTLLFIALAATGRLSLTGSHALETLPDVAPLREGEFKKVQIGTEVTAMEGEAELPQGHTLVMGQSQRFGDVLVTPVKVTREPLGFVSMLTGAADKDKTTSPVLKLWFRVKNVSPDFAFPPWDVSLMSSRHPAEGTDDSTAANSWLIVTQGSEEKRILNYLHSPKSSFDLIDQSSRKMIHPGEELETYVACSEQIAHVTKADSYRWRLQIRKGVNKTSGNSVTTLVDVLFSDDDIGT